MKLLPGKPTVLHKKGHHLLISNEDLLVLMQDVLSKGATFQFRAKGWSMTPFIKDGDVITIAPVKNLKPAVGKVVAFMQPASRNLIVHRVVGRQDQLFLIKGDNTDLQPDGWIRSQDILGSVSRVERAGRRIYLGQGLERYLLAFLARNGWLDVILRKLRAFRDLLCSFKD